MSALLESPFFGIALTVLAYWLGVQAQKRTGLVICNNMIVSVALLIAVLTLFHIPYEAYYEGGSVINMFLGPATACMAVTVYAKKDLLKRNWLPVLVGCLTGVVVSVGSILVMSRLFGLDAAMTASLLPKSVTTPIATAIAEGHGTGIELPKCGIVSAAALSAQITASGLRLPLSFLFVRDRATGFFLGRVLPRRRRAADSGRLEYDEEQESRNKRAQDKNDPCALTFRLPEQGTRAGSRFR